MQKRTYHFYVHTRLYQTMLDEHLHFLLVIDTLKTKMVFLVIEMKLLIAMLLYYLYHQHLILIWKKEYTRSQSNLYIILNLMIMVTGLPLQKNHLVYLKNLLQLCARDEKRIEENHEQSYRIVNNNIFFVYINK
jgi:TRAP-type C4-dicarboxylate transport system permease large subunit